MIEKADLESVFDGEIRDAHDNWKLLCPFHDEKTPSFYVHKEEYIGHCFGCGIGGRIDVLAAKHLAISESEARKRLGMGLAELVSAKSRSVQRTNERKVQQIPESWLAPFKKEVHKYVIDRGIMADTVRAAKGRYDRALRRQVFPHYDQSSGRFLGAIGRACYGQEPKWLFYWDYRKGEALYDPFKDHQSRRTLLVVEGVFDVLWLYQAGYNACALLGSKPTRAQIRELKSIGVDLISGLDNDAAGIEGTRILFDGLRRSTPLTQVVWPSFANDWGDLSKEQIDEVIGNAKNKVELCLQGNSSISKNQ